MNDRIRLSVGPQPSMVATDWIDNRKALLRAARTAPTGARNDDAIDLLDMFLDLWLREAQRSETFQWSQELTTDVLLLVARYWLELGGLTQEDRAAMGVPPAPPHTDAFTQAVAEGMAVALGEAGDEGRDLLARLSLEP